MTSPKTVTPDQPQAVPDMVLVPRSIANFVVNLANRVSPSPEGSLLAEALAACPVLPVETPAEGLREAFVYRREHDMRELAMPASRSRDGIRIYRVPEIDGEKLHPLFTTPAPLSGRDGSLREAARAVIAAAGTTYRKRNGQIGTLEGEDGEMMVLVPSDEFEHFRAALAAVPPETAEMEGEPVLLREMYTDSEWALLQERDAADRFAARASSSGEAGDETRR